jgi:hypothetical protein
MNIRKFILGLSLGLGLLLSISSKAQVAVDRPKLVVGIVVDQMRWDYLYRYYDRYAETGFKRLLNQGFTCENTMINYIPSYTAIGHATVYTGSVPSIHGIAGNDFIVQATGKKRYCTQDDDVFAVGAPDKNQKEGKMSPRNLRVTTITDELKLATNFRSKVIGVSLKDRGSILPAGHAADAAYWFDGQSGNWITSTYYRNELPAWLTQFNEKKPVEEYLSRDWNTLYPIDTYLQSTNDNNAYEETYRGVDKVLFPIKTSSLIKTNGPDLIRSTPYGNTLTLDVARAIIENEQMGQRDIVDFIAISLSTPDYIGHKFGPNSIKVEDCYLRLDKDLGDFFSYLDKTVGKGNYLVFLTADHGGAHNGQFLIDHQIPSGIWNEWEITNNLNDYLKNKFKIEKLVLSLSNYQVNFNYKQIESSAINRKELREAVIEFFNKMDNVAYVTETGRVSEASIPAVLKEKIVNGYNKDLSGEIQVILQPGWYSDGDLRGATHGSWNPYDTHIPLVWMGWGIKHGSSNQEVCMTDIAPTVAALLHIQMPNGCIGRPIIDVVGK